MLDKKIKVSFLTLKWLGVESAPLDFSRDDFVEFFFFEARAFVTFPPESCATIFS